MTGTSDDTTGVQGFRRKIQFDDGEGIKYDFKSTVTNTVLIASTSAGRTSSSDVLTFYRDDVNWLRMKSCQ